VLQLTHGDDLRPQDQNQFQIDVKKVKAWFERLQSDWLLILDNADDINLELPGLLNFVPIGKHGHIIITSRDPLSRGIGPGGLRIDNMECTDAVSLLLKRAGKESTQQNVMHAELIVRGLGCLPLAVDQAGAFILARHLEVRDLATRLEQQSQSLLRYKIPSSMQQYESSVLTTWEISLDSVENKCEEASRLLQLLGVCEDSMTSLIFIRGNDKC
jgi:hypothetical protein